MMEKSGDGFIDRSRVRILLCDNDEKSSEEVFTLLCKCSYQVTSVRSPRQVIDALNAEGPDIDIILSEIDLPMSKGLKMLKYITRDKELRRIPVIMMSAQDEVSIVVKCLKFGASDYLVKPLRTNELLNLWTHMWRRRRMLGLVEKNIVNYEIDLVASDPSDPNTNSTTLFSDDTDEKSRKSTNPEPCNSKHQEGETNATTAAPTETTVGPLSGCQLDNMPEITDRQTGPMSLFPKKSELRIGESSAFFMYVKSSTIKNKLGSSVHENAPQHVAIADNFPIARRQVDAEIEEKDSQADDYPSSTNVHSSFSMQRSSTPPIALNALQHRNSEELSQVHMQMRSGFHNDVPVHYAHSTYPYYMSGVASPVTMQSAPMHHKNSLDLHNHVNSTMLPQYNNIPHCPPHIPGMAPYPYYSPFGMCLQPGQIPSTHPWQSFRNSSGNEVKVTKIDRREAALMKFRQKRKERCFDKKIRYVNRKKLAERRPRLRGQFVRKVNGVNVDLNGQPASAEDDEEEEEDYDDEDQSANMDVYPGGASMCRQ